MKRIDQHLFSNIVKMSYEADKAWKDWLKEYSIRSEKEKNGYIYFSSKIRKIAIFDEKENKELKIFDLWINISEKDKKKWINDAHIIDDMFTNVETFLSIFQHNI
jgi:hypothetical protein